MVTTTRIQAAEEVEALYTGAMRDRGISAGDRNAAHPVNAILNYGYAVLQCQVQIKAAVDGSSNGVYRKRCCFIGETFRFTWANLGLISNPPLKQSDSPWSAGIVAIF
jgi:hypothetical protein